MDSFVLHRFNDITEAVDNPAGRCSEVQLDPVVSPVTSSMM